MYKMYCKRTKKKRVKSNLMLKGKKLNTNVTRKMRIKKNSKKFIRLSSSKSKINYILYLYFKY